MNIKIFILPIHTSNTSPTRAFIMPVIHSSRVYIFSLTFQHPRLIDHTKPANFTKFHTNWYTKSASTKKFLIKGHTFIDLGEITADEMTAADRRLPERLGEDR